jgi:membrane-associated phospholipid phosphatase
MRMARSAGNIAGFAFGVGTLLGAAVLARRPITQTEIRTFREVNELPGDVYWAIWLPMQYGTFGTVPAAAALALARRRPRLALAIAAGGTAAWVLAKAVKPMVDRGRPASVLGDVSLRGAEEGDRGYPSGHAAVSAALTVMIWPFASNGWRATLAALAGFVPFARMYVGAHLPLDVVGGSALGVAIGSAVNLAIPRHALRVKLIRAARRPLPADER